MMTSRSQRQQRGLLPTYIDDPSAASARRRMGIPTTSLNGSLSAMIMSPTRSQWCAIVLFVAMLFIGARIAVPATFHTASDLVEPAAKSDPTITLLVAEPESAPITRSTIPPTPSPSSSPPSIVINAPPAPPPFPPPSPSLSSLPTIKTIDERNDARTDTDAPTDAIPPPSPTQLRIDPNLPVSPSASDLDPPRGASVPLTEWIPEGPFEERSVDEETLVTEKRRQAIRDAMSHAWAGYELYAFGHDELRPVTNATNDSWGKWGVTLVDALDTLILMGFNEEVTRARAHVAKINWDVNYDVSFFETSIRYLGGLLSAYELSRDAVYLTKAAELGERLAASFDTTKTGLPQSIINLHTKRSHNHNWNGGASILAEVGSVQLEFAYLAHHMNQSKFNDINDKSRKVFTILDQATKPYTGLYPVYIDADSGTFTGQTRISFGSLADSFYEYLLKLWLLSDKTDDASLRMYNEAMIGFTNKIIHRKSLLNDNKEKIGEWTFMGELSNDRLVKEQEHLTCFMPGLLALGGWHGLHHAEILATRRNGGEPTAAERTLSETAAIHISLAEELAATCAESYFQTHTGLGPESIQFDQVGHSSPWNKQNNDKRSATRRPRTIGTIWEVAKSKYILRPETLESLFILWRVTGDRKYREWGWHIFEALQVHCRTPSSYSGLQNVDAPPNGEAGIKSNWDNSMQSFYFAETLKYLYLLFSPSDVIPLDKFVFNTEAHPLGIIR